MGTRVAARQVLLWTVRNSTSGYSPLQFGRCHIRDLCFRSSSSINQTTLPSTPQQQQQRSHDLSAPLGNPVPELSLHSLLDMGFTDTQAEQVYDTVAKVKGRSVSKHALSTLTALFVLGLNPSSVLKLLEKCPELYTIKESQLQQRIANLRKLGLVEGSLQRVVAHCPQILTAPVKTIKNAVLFFRERFLFTSQQITDILRDSPAVVLENMEQLEYKFQYVYFRMGIKQAEMLKSRLFRFDLDEVRSRHCFLERRGLYQTPDKKGQTLIVNPTLESVLGAEPDAFLAHVANTASAEEYDVFKRLMAREWQQQDRQQGSVVADSDDDDDVEEEDEDEDEEASGKAGYRNRKKKGQRGRDREN